MNRNKRTSFAAQASTRSEKRRARGLKGGYPLSGNTGGNSKRPSVAIDWLRAVSASGPQDEGSEGELSRTRQWVERRFGAPDRMGRGKDRYEHGIYWANGVQVLHGHRVAGVSLVIPGSVLAEHSFGEQLEILREVLMGRRATRIDIAVDFYGHVGLIDSVRKHALDPVQRRELDAEGRPLSQLVGARRVDPHEEWHGAECVRFGINLGRRGSDGSGRYVRVYDKGLETGRARKGQWERWEAEFCGDVAQDVSEGLVRASDEHRAALLAFEYAVGAVDFLEVKTRQRGKSAGTMCFPGERDRASWWKVIRGTGENVRAVGRRPESTLDGCIQNLQNAVAPLVRVARELRVDPMELIRYALGPMKKAFGPMNRTSRRYLEELMRLNVIRGGRVVQYLATEPAPF